MALVDIILVPLAYFYIFGIIILASSLKRQEVIDGQLARKVVHLGIGILVIAAPLLFTQRWFPTAIGFSFIIITFFTSPGSPISKWKLTAFKDGHKYGTVYYSISLTLLLYFFFDQGWIIQVAFLPLVFGDAFANIVGIRYGNHKWPSTTKSMEGSLAGGIASFIIVMLSLSFYLFINQFPGIFSTILFLSLGVAIIMPLIELLSPSGLDNLTIPFTCLVLALIVNLNLTPSCENLFCIS